MLVCDLQQKEKGRGGYAGGDWGRVGSNAPYATVTTASDEKIIELHHARDRV